MEWFILIVLIGIGLLYSTSTYAFSIIKIAGGIFFIALLTICSAIWLGAVGIVHGLVWGFNTANDSNTFGTSEKSNNTTNWDL